MTKKILRSIRIVALSVFLASAALIMGFLYGHFSDVQREQLKAQTRLVAQGATNNGSLFFEGLNMEDYRITWIDSKGTVIYDSVNSPYEMENHSEREEVVEALKSGYGESSRYSTTLMERSLYSAIRLNDGSIIRLSDSQKTVFTLLIDMFRPLLMIAIIAVALSLMLASRLSKRIVKPLNELNLDDPLSNDGYAELSPLLRRIDDQQNALRAQAVELARRQDELNAVTGNMNEGLILLNNKGTILSINHAASSLLDTDEHCVGRDILTVNRSAELSELIKKAQLGGRMEKVIELHEGEYQLDASPVFSNGEVHGVALLIFDVTEKARAERRRREFTANVSHELKTPLRTISGCAELLKNGLVRSEDVDLFSEKILCRSSTDDNPC